MSTAPEFAAVIEAMRRTRRCLVSSHIDPEGDSLGSQLVLADMLRELGKEVRMVDAERPPERFDFMPGIAEIVTPADVVGETFDTAFIVDCGSLDRIGSVAAMVAGLEIVNIDHHGSNARFGGINHVVPDACATGILLFELNEALGLPLDRRKATNIYTAIITDTGNFQYSNTSAEVLRVASRLIDAGADPATLALRVFGTKPLSALKLLAEALATLEIERDGRLGIITIGRDAFDRARAVETDVDGIVNFANRVQGVLAGVLLRESEQGDVKASFRSDGEVDVDTIAARFGGGGHRNAAGARLDGPLPAARRRVLEAFDAVLDAPARPVR